MIVAVHDIALPVVYDNSEVIGRIGQQSVDDMAMDRVEGNQLVGPLSIRGVFAPFNVAHARSVGLKRNFPAETFPYL